MSKNSKILLICLLAAVMVAGWWSWQKNDQGDKNETAFTTGFVMLDDEKNLIWSEAVQISLEAKLFYEDKIKEIKADLAVAKEKEQLLADYNNLAIYQKYLGNYREAYAAYLESLSLESQARVTWQNLADVLLKMKAVKSAEMAYLKAIELNKYIPESYVKLANYYKVVGDIKSVEATYKTAIEIIKQSMESDTLVLDAYAEWLAAQKRYDEAIKIYQELIVKQPGNKEAILRKIEGLKK